MSLEFWRMGGTPVPATEIGRFSRQFEEWGWDGFAVGEAHGLLPDPYVVLSQAAAATTTIKVGTAENLKRMESFTLSRANLWGSFGQNDIPTVSFKLL